MAQIDSDARQVVNVALGARSYDIVVGPDLIAQPVDAFSCVVRGRRIAVVTDINVAGRYLKPIKDKVAAAGANCVSEIILPAGEATKSFGQLESVVAQLLDARITRQDIVIALGGGVIGDLTGFAASILRRGVDFIQVPTTILAQVDSSVGGKTAINTLQGKNLVGAFYQPRLVLADTSVLETLPPRERMAGFAEIIKYGLINDPGFFAWLQTNGKDVIAGKPAALGYAIAQSCAAKAKIVIADEREQGVRALLNLGHTFGHAIEAHAGYDGRILHGEAVSIGMAMAHHVSHALGYLDAEGLRTVLATFTDLGLPTHPRQFGLGGLTAQEMVHHMLHDKKNVDSRITLILSRSIGGAFLTRDVAASQLQRLIADYFDQQTEPAQ